MKKLLLCLIILMLTGCRNTTNMLKNIEINNDNCKIQEDIDTHGGFLGDGEYFAKIYCSNITTTDLSSNWKELPLSDTINEIMDMIKCDNKECSDTYEKYHIPKNINGYYYFIDRHSESVNKYDDKDLNNRASYNFNLAIFDITNKTIYYYELDT